MTIGLAIALIVAIAAGVGAFVGTAAGLYHGGRMIATALKQEFGVILDGSKAGEKK